uniref:Uncharacterized protein n=1 Tax=Rhizophora mucronata TaxID=61149 RepID=A0A2P2N6P0_RHIMU
MAFCLLHEDVSQKLEGKTSKHASLYIFSIGI